MKISIIVWDANFREYTHTIDFFARQNFAKNNYEFIWVDFYNSNDRIRKKIDGYSNTRLVSLGNLPDTLWHLGTCINEAVKISSGELIVIPDGDIAVEPDFLSYVWDAHQKYQDLILYFKRYDEPKHAASEQSHSSIPHLQQHARLTNPTNYAGCLSLKRKNFERINGYETHEVFSGPGINGMETYIRLRNAGMAIKWAPEKKIYHPWHPSSGSTGHGDDMVSALNLAKISYPWIYPYAGIKQSWIIHRRKLSGETLANEETCEKSLMHMPYINMERLLKLAKIWTFLLRISMYFELLKKAENVNGTK